MMDTPMNSKCATLLTFSKISLTLLFPLLMLGWPSHHITAEEQCYTKDKSETIVLLVCSNDSHEAQWKNAGKAACESKNRCNAWIWGNPADVPDEAPLQDVMLPKNKTAKALAVWVNDSQSLIKINKTKK